MTRPPMAAETEPEIGGIVLAAGEGKRFGGVKQVARLDGRPLLEHAVRAMLSVPSISPVVVVLGAHAGEIQAAVDFSGADVVVCDQWAAGQSASLQAGVAALGEVEAAVITLGDQPHIDARAIAAVIAARSDGVDAVRATYDGVPGHPVLLERALFAELRALRGDTGARAVLAEAAVRDVRCDGLGDAYDVDAAEDLRG